MQNKGGKNAHPDMLNVILIGIDSVSRLNMIRHMPNTYEYLTRELEAIDFRGYNKVDDNTYQNMMPILTGMNRYEYQNHSCSHEDKKPLTRSKYDNCPFIWKEFAYNGYVTAFIEDWAKVGMFPDLRMGFLKEPTDFYNRPYQLASESLISSEKQYQGTRPSFSIVYDLVRDLNTVSQEVPFFILSWTASLTHEGIHHASGLDKPSKIFLEELGENGHLNKSILFFISDHGMRYGRLRQTYIGRWEERLPYIMIVFPTWFKVKYSETWNILNKNTDRLISNFDLHLTLKDIAQQKFYNSSNPQSLYGHGQSLFTEISPNRTCFYAGIPEHYCTCDDIQETNADPATIMAVIYFSIDFINNLLSKDARCSLLSLQEVRQFYTL